MNQLEFNETLKILNITNKTTEKYPNYQVDIYFWNNLTFHYNTKKFYCSVEGNIPLEIINIMNQKYPNNPYTIRVINEATKQNSLETYHINTKEELLTFIIAFQNYYAKLHQQPEISFEQYHFLETALDIQLINTLNPFISTEDWMKEAITSSKTKPNTYKLYQKTINKPHQTTLDHQIRKSLVTIDTAINPFQNPEHDFTDLTRFTDKLKINGYTFQQENHLTRPNCIEMVLTNKDTNNQTSYTRTPDGFYYDLTYSKTKKESISLIHSFSNHEPDQFDNGELLIIQVREKGELTLDLRYNLTLELISNSCENIQAITPQQKQFIHQKLVEISFYASTITQPLTIKEETTTKMKKRKKSPQKN